MTWPMRPLGAARARSSVPSSRSIASEYAGPITRPNAIIAPRMLGSATAGTYRSVPSTFEARLRNRYPSVNSAVNR